jgi:hypothetical protein
MKDNQSSTEIPETTPFPDEKSDKPSAWEQQAGEKPDQYEAFLIYLNIERDSLDMAYRIYYARKFPERWKEAVKGGTESQIVASGAFSTWARQWGWRDRRAEYYHWLNAQVQLELSQRRIKAMVETVDLGTAMRRLAAEALEGISATVRFKTLAEDGREVWVLASQLKINEILALANAGMMTERLVFGEPTQITENRQDNQTADERGEARTKQAAVLLDIAQQRKTLEQIRKSTAKRKNKIS